MSTKLSWSGLAVKIGAAGDVLRKTLGIAPGNGHFRPVFGLAALGFRFNVVVHDAWSMLYYYTMLSQKRSGMGRGKIILVTLCAMVAVFALFIIATSWSFTKLIKDGAVDTLESLNYNSKFSTDKKTVAATSGAVNAESSAAPSLGNEKAAVRVVEFIDFGCPYSKEENSIIRELAVSNPDRVWLQVRNFPIDELHPGARSAAVAARCAAAQDKYWAMHDAIFANQNDQGTFAAADLRRLALNVGVDGAKYDACIKDGKTADAVSADRDAGVALGVTGTPTFFVNGYKIDGAIPFDIWQKILKLVK